MGESKGFDAEMTVVYAKIAEQHRHPQGPWEVMVKEVGKVIEKKCGAGGGDRAMSNGSKLKIVDGASGQGEPAISIAVKFPEHEVISTDFSPDMVAKAESTINAMKEAASEPMKQKNPDSSSISALSNISCTVADLQSMPFEANSVDIVTVCYGFMFPADMQKAVDEVYRILKPGGTLISTSWDTLNVIKLVGDITAAITETENPPPPAMNPMRLSEPKLFESMCEKSGFKNLQVTQQCYPFDLGNVESEKMFQYRFGTLLMKNKIAELDAEARAQEAFWANITKYTKIENGKMIMPDNKFKLTLCEKP